MGVTVLRVNPERPEPEAIERAAEEILRGACIAFPTDTFYGLGCTLMDPAAVEMIYRLKRRGPELALISLIAEPEAVEALAAEVSESARRLMKRHWPGPLSLVFRSSVMVPAGSRGPDGTVALRCPEHPLSVALVRAVGGPVVATSANLHGRPPARSAEEVLDHFGNQVALVLDGGAATATRPSTLVDVSRGGVRVLRAGSIEVEESGGVA